MLTTQQPTKPVEGHEPAVMAALAHVKPAILLTVLSQNSDAPVPSTREHFTGPVPVPVLVPVSEPVPVAVTLTEHSDVHALQVAFFSAVIHAEVSDEVHFSKQERSEQSHPCTQERYELHADSTVEISDEHFASTQEVHAGGTVSEAGGFLQVGMVPEPPPDELHPAVTATATTAPKDHPNTCFFIESLLLKGFRRNSQLLGTV